MTELTLVSGAPSHGRRSRSDGTLRERRLAPGRPSDNRDAWSVGDVRALKGLRTAAAACGIDVDTAAGIAIEFELCRRELRQTPFDHLADTLHARPAEQRIVRRLAAADASYLRGLMHGTAMPVRSATDVVLLPTRLTARVLEAGGPDELLKATGLDQAIAWEITSLLAGRTMSEWWPRELLAQLAT